MKRSEQRPENWLSVAQIARLTAHLELLQIERESDRFLERLERFKRELRKVWREQHG